MIVHSKLQFFPNPQIFFHILHYNNLTIQQLFWKHHIFWKERQFVVGNLLSPAIIKSSKWKRNTKLYPRIKRIFFMVRKSAWALGVKFNEKPFFKLNSCDILRKNGTCCGRQVFFFIGEGFEDFSLTRGYHW